MNLAHDHIVPGNGLHTRPVSQFRRAAVTAVAAVLAILCWGRALGQTSQPDDAVPGAQVLTRGPVHEAFAGNIACIPLQILRACDLPRRVSKFGPSSFPDGSVMWQLGGRCN
jgi:hypothetical protein